MLWKAKEGASQEEKACFFAIIPGYLWLISNVPAWLPYFREKKEKDGRWESVMEKRGVFIKYNKDALREVEGRFNFVWFIVEYMYK